MSFLGNKDIPEPMLDLSKHWDGFFKKMEIDIADSFEQFGGETVIINSVTEDTIENYKQNKNTKGECHNV